MAATRGCFVASCIDSLYEQPVQPMSEGSSYVVVDDGAVCVGRIKCVHNPRQWCGTYSYASEGIGSLPSRPADLVTTIVDENSKQAFTLVPTLGDFVVTGLLPPATPIFRIWAARQASFAK